MAAFNNIRAFLNRVRVRRLSIAAGEVALSTLLVALIVFGVAVFTAYAVPEPHLPWVQWSASTAMCITFVAMGSIFGLRVLWLLRHDAEVARLMQRSHPNLGGDVLSCVELEATYHQHVQPEVTRELTYALAMHTAAQLPSIRVDVVAPSRRILRMLQALVVTSAALIAASFLFTHEFKDGLAALRDGARPSAAYPVYDRMEERDVLVGDISYTLTYPAYTHLSDRVESNTSGDLQVLKGTQVRVITRALEAASSASIVFDDSSVRVVPMTIEGDMLSGQFTVMDDTTYHFELNRMDGTRFVERAMRLVEVVPDTKPVVDVLQPTTDIVVRTLEPVRIFYSTSDDFGVSRIALVTSRFETGQPAVHRRVGTPDGERQFVGDAEVDLTQLDIEAGESIEVWLEAYDNNTVADSLQMSRSRKIRIKRHSPGEKHDENIQGQRKLVESMLDVLADRLESPIERQRLTKYTRIIDVQRQVLSSAQALCQELTDVLERLKVDPLANQDVIAVIRDIGERYDAHHRVENGQIRKAIGETRSSEKAERLEALAQANESSVSDLERDIYRLDDLIAQQHQMRLVERAKAISEVQKELSDLMEQLESADDPAVRHRVQQKLNKLLRQIQKLLAQTQRQAQVSPYENMNLDALETGETVQEMQTLMGTIQQMQEAIQNGRLDQARKLADDLGRRIQMLNTELESGLQELTDQRTGQGQNQLKKLVRGVKKVVSRQEAVERSTRTLDEQGKQALNTLIKEREAPNIAKQLEGIRELGRRLAKVDSDAIHEDDADALETISDAVSDLRETLAQEDLGQAVPLSKAVRDLLRGLEREVEHGAERLAEREGDSYRVKKRREQRRRIGSARRKARQIASELERMMPKPQDLFDRRQQKRLERLAERQQRVQERLERLLSKLPALEDEIPGVTQRLSKSLEEASSEMQEAARRLSENQPGRAIGHEERARDRLNKFQDAASRELQRRGGGQRNRPGVGNNQQDVAIPEADRYAVPKEYRDALLQSLRERAPSGYKRLIQRYYEALVQ